jgi:purine-binding chemotaxis protein CheW
MLVFVVQGQQHALPINQVFRVFLMAEITPAPDPKPWMLGVIDIHGELVPVVNLRRVLSLPEREIELSDQLVVAGPAGERLALWVDAGSSVLPMPPAEQLFRESSTPEGSPARTLVRTSGGVIWLHDISRFRHGLDRLCAVARRSP